MFVLLINNIFTIQESKHKYADNQPVATNIYT